MKSLKAYRNIQTCFNTTRQTETVIAEDYEGYCIEFKDDDEVYLKPEVDKMIAELKQEIERLKKQSSCIFSEDCLRVRQLRAENESLKAKLAEKDEEIDKQKWRGDEWAKACNQKDKEIESLKASHYAEMVDEGMRECRLKRALYKACANWAHHRVFVRYKTNEKAWENVERKCRAMEEKYK